MSTEPIHDWHSDGSECACVGISVGPHTWTKGYQSDLWFESSDGAHTGTDRGVPLLLDRIEQLEAELRDTANAVEFEDDRIGYVSVQMDRDVWIKYREVQP